MNTVTTTGTTLEILAPYLPYGIEVEVEYADVPPKEVGRLASLSLNGPSAQVHFREPRHASGFVSVVCGLHEMKPVLRPFSALPHVLVETPWGATPASVVLARMITNMQVMPEHVRLFGDNALSAQEYSSGHFKMFLHADTVEKANLMYPVVEWLRRRHFAVGLAPHQFIEKQD